MCCDNFTDQNIIITYLGMEYFAFLLFLFYHNTAESQCLIFCDPWTYSKLSQEFLLGFRYLYNLHVTNGAVRHRKG